MRETWTDHRGQVWKVPTILRRLKFKKIPCHAALRAFVFHRDGYRCRACGVLGGPVPLNYDGRHAIGIPGWESHRSLVMDHVLSRRNGGAHHPDNLVTLCDSCNAAKAALVDARVGG
jgi:5-methylcytosine-specific restriction endonuclease McrA